MGKEAIYSYGQESIELGARGYSKQRRQAGSKSKTLCSSLACVEPKAKTRNQKEKAEKKRRTKA
jgi:hypothetical protein